MESPQYNAPFGRCSIFVLLRVCYKKKRTHAHAPKTHHLSNASDTFHTLFACGPLNATAHAVPQLFFLLRDCGWPSGMRTMLSSPCTAKSIHSKRMLIGANFRLSDDGIANMCSLIGPQLRVGDDKSKCLCLCGNPFTVRRTDTAFE